MTRPRRVWDPSQPTLGCPGQARVHRPVLLGQALTRASPVCADRTQGPAAAESHGSLVKGPGRELSHKCPEDHVSSHHMWHMTQAQWHRYGYNAQQVRQSSHWPSQEGGDHRRGGSHCFKTGATIPPGRTF